MQFHPFSSTRQKGRTPYKIKDFRSLAQLPIFANEEGSKFIIATPFTGILRPLFRIGVNLSTKTKVEKWMIG